MPGTPAVYAVLAYTDPEGHGNYDATTATAIPDAEGNFTLHCTDLQAGKSASLRLIALYANGEATSHVGTWSPYTFPYSVGADGKPDLKTWNLVKAFLPVQEAIAADDVSAAEPLLEALSRSEDAQIAAIAQRALRSGFAQPAPSEINTSITSVALADVAPSEAQVG